MPYKSVDALLRGLAVLEAVNVEESIGLTALHRKVGIPKATTFRMVETMRATGYIDYEPSSQTYHVGLRALALSTGFSRHDHLLRIAAPVMQKLRRRLGWPSDLAVFQHDKMVIIDTNREPGTLSSNRTVGSRVPVLASATGRAYLANTSAEERDAIVSRLRESTDHYEAAAKNPQEITRIVNETRGRGYAISDGEFLPTNCSAAVAITVAEHDVICVINMIGLAHVIRVEDIHTRYAAMLTEAKSELEEALAGHKGLTGNQMGSGALHDAVKETG